MSQESRKVAFATFGCKVNQYETAAVREELAAAGHDAVTLQGDGAPDVVVVNTCTVTSRADQKARQAIRRIHRDHPGAEIIVTGCSVDSDGAALAALPGVAKTVPNAGKGGLASMLTAGTAGTTGTDGAAAPTIGLKIARFPGHTRAFLKIEDGCHLNCTYCIIPRVRGAVTSKPVADVLAEAEVIAQHHPEIVLTGIHLGGWGMEFTPRLHVADLLPRLARTPGLKRLRLSSLEFQEVTPKLIDVLARGGVFAPHMHLPLQGGSDAVLRAMKRGYRRRTIFRSVGELRAAIPNIGLTTDVIVGFPGESDDDFAQTLDLCAELRMHKIHRFPYSVRPGTPAETLPDHVAPEVKQRRMAQLAEVEAEQLQRRGDGLRGAEVEVLIETPHPDAPSDGTGFTGCYVNARVEGAGDRRGQLVRARAESFDGETLICREAR
ncbi:MAG: tRNA (N(6)-L-threonylcarbamoyladenosine(37)-C(2))-methylthiotransferase MtaB [Planctomycetota bacterium]|jgi:threonylcarbamoyladenosine tRNA methylthiotransferase MtaB